MRIELEPMYVRIEPVIEYDQGEWYVDEVKVFAPDGVEFDASSDVHDSAEWIAKKVLEEDHETLREMETNFWAEHDAIMEDKWDARKDEAFDYYHDSNR